MSGLVGNSNQNSVLDSINAYWNVINTQASGTLDLLAKWNGEVKPPKPVVIPSTVNDTANQTTETSIMRYVLIAGAGLAVIAAGAFLYKKI